jgi:hypothetical protein
VLDIGSGAFGIRGFLRDYTTIGADREVPVPTVTPFVVADITALPLPARAVEVVTGIDVLEHLPVQLRASAIRDMVRVAKRGVVVAFPHGEVGRAFDQEYKTRLDARQRPAPAWLGEHLSQPYPTVGAIKEWILDAALVEGRGAAVVESYAEPVWWGRWARRAAVRSPAMFMAVSLGLGAAARFLRPPDADDGYRAILAVELTDGRR